MNIDEKAAELRETYKQELGEIELEVLTNYTLADAIRGGSSVTKQTAGWGDGCEAACAMTAAVLDAKALGFIPVD